jgi:hypothetical protein
VEPRKLFADERLGGVCVYCGGPPDTVDHVPPKVLLDDPLPSNLPGVDACSACNQGFSLDEEYFACLLECVLSGTADPVGVQREKVRRALARNPRLASRLEASKKTDHEGRLAWQPESERVRKVVLKPARGHAAYELSQPQLDDPREVACTPIMAMSASQRVALVSEEPGKLAGWPEIGSRAFYRACGAFPNSTQEGKWIVVQPGRYRYSVEERGGVIVQVVIGEYLACTVEWE